MNKVPAEIKKQIKGAVYEKADKHSYLFKGRVENGLFMDNLVRDPDVGSRLADFMSKAEIKTYIKDAILNRYSKDKLNAQLSIDVTPYLKKLYGKNISEIEAWKKERVTLHRIESGGYIVVSRGGYVKWETALRKALEIIEKCPGLPVKDEKLHILLVIAPSGKHLTEPDKNCVESTLSHIDVDIIFIGS